MREGTFRQTVARKLKEVTNREIHIQAHEEKFLQGVPDQHYCYHGKAGWIELKYLKAYPKKGFIKIPHFTPHQKLWLKQYAKAKGRAWLLLHIEKDIYLIHPNQFDLMENMTKDRLMWEVCSAFWLNRKVDWQELLSLLTVDIV